MLSPRIAALLIGTLAAFAPSAGFAQSSGFDQISAPLRLRSSYFGWGASVTASAGYSDNIDLRSDGLREGSFIQSNTFSGSAVISTPRFTGVASGDVTLSYLSKAREKFAVDQRVGATTTTTLADNLLYLDVSGSTSRQLLGENARFSANLTSARGQQVNVSAVSASPYLHRTFPNGAKGELRYRFSQVFIGDTRADANPFRGGLLNNSTTQEASAIYQTEDLFERLQIVASAYGDSTVEKGSTFAPEFRYRQGTGGLTVRYSLTDQFALSGAVGYDKVVTRSGFASSSFNDEALTGVYWRGGFTARPGPRTLLRAEYGQRYGKGFVSGEFSYDLSKRAQIYASADRRLDTRARGVDSQFSEFQQSTLSFVDRLRDGGSVDARQVADLASQLASRGQSSQSIGIGTFNTVTGGLRGVWGRTTVNASGAYEKADFGFRTVRSYDANLFIERRLARRLSIYSNGFYRRSKSDFDPTICETNPFLFGFSANTPGFDPVAACQSFALQNGRTDTVGGRFGARWRIYENLSAFGEYSHTKRFGGGSDLRYDENAVLAGVKLDF